MNTERCYRGRLVRRVAHRLSLPLERVQRSLEQSDRLQEICKEYEACQAAAERWRSIKDAGHSRLEEFETISDELETEMTRSIAEHADDSTRNTRP